MKGVETTAFPDVTVGVITYASRFDSISGFLELLIPAIEHYQVFSQKEVELLLVNNSGADRENDLNSHIGGLLDDTSFVCTRLNSPKNNIATGRNSVITQSRFPFVAFIDDDEIPQNSWLTELATAISKYQSAAVTAPVHPEFPPDTPEWIANFDLHNTAGKQEGESVRFTATCNVIIDKNKIGHILFDEDFGQTGGSDTQFFLRLTDNSQQIVWTNKASLIETIPKNRSNFRYLLKRGISQGRNYRRIMSERNEIRNGLLFTCRALIVLVISSVVASGYILLRNPKASFWLKRAFANLGFIKTPKKNLYD